MADPSLSDRAKKAIEEFSEVVALDRKMAAAVSKIIAENPSAVLIAWEQEGSIKVTSIPFSVYLIRGMVDGLYELVCIDQSGAADDSDAED